MPCQIACEAGRGGHRQCWETPAPLACAKVATAGVEDEEEEAHDAQNSGWVASDVLQEPGKAKGEDERIVGAAKVVGHFRVVGSSQLGPRVRALVGRGATVSSTPDLDGRVLPLEHVTHAWQAGCRPPGQLGLAVLLLILGGEEGV